MKKVAIVGVEGSGKTVLMAAMGEKYRKPRADGLFLYANSRRTIEYCNEQIDILRNQHKWPNSTSPDSLVNLEWTLMRRRKGNRPEEVCTVAFLDFAGEIYRYAFGDSTDDSDQIKQSQYKSQVEAVKSHLKDADSVVVLVNLSDIINSKGDSKKSSEMDWLSQRIFDFVFSETSARQVSIVFTQKDLYEETIANCGGLEDTFEEYLPSVFYRNESRIVPFAVSAVNKTVMNESGNLAPATDFGSEGLEALVSWMDDWNISISSDDSTEEFSDDSTEEFIKACNEGRYDEAVKLSNNVDRHNRSVVQLLGKMYSALGNHNKAIECLQLALTMVNDEISESRQVQKDAGTRHQIAKAEANWASSHYEVVLKQNFHNELEKAERGNAESQYFVGEYYLRIEKDHDKAMDWYRKSAENGYARAMEEIRKRENMVNDQNQGLVSGKIELSNNDPNSGVDKNHRGEVDIDKDSETGCLMRFLNILYTMLFVAAIVVILYLSFKE